MDNYSYASIDNNLTYISLRSRLVSGPIRKINSNNEQKFSFTSLLSVTFGIILILKLRGENYMNVQKGLRTLNNN